MSKLGLAGSALLATAGGATTLASGLTITAHASEKPKTNTQQTNQADKLKKASNQLDTASKQQAKMINALLESKVDAQVPTQPGTYTKSVALLDASGKQLGTATLTRVVNTDGSTQSSLSKDIPAGYTLKDVNVLNHYPSAVTLTRVADATPAGTTTKAIKLTDANGKLIANGTVTRVVDEKGASTVSVKGIPQGYKVASMEVLKTFPDQLVIEKGEAINSQTQQKTNEDQRGNVTPVTPNESNTHLTTGGQSQQAGNTTSGTTTDNTGSQSGQAQQGGTTNADQGKTDAGTTNTGADANKGQQTSDASKDSSETSTDSKTTTDQGKTDTKKDDSKTSTSTTDSAKKDDTKKDDSKASTAEKKDDSKSDTSKTNASKTTDNSKTNDTNSKVDNAIKGIDSVAKGSTDATKSADSKSSDTDKKNDSKKSDSSKSDNKKSDDKKSDKKDGKLDLSDTTDALKKSSKDDDKKDSNSDNSSKKDNVSNLLNKSANKSSKASDNAKVADADVSDNLSGKDDSTKKGTTSSSTNATLPETGNTQSTAGILAGSAMVATMTALGIGASRRKRV